MAADKLMQVVDELVDEYEMDRGFTTLVGGGGSGGVLIPYLAEREGFKWRIAKNAPYISTIGVALAMVREQIERSIVNPTEDDVLKIRHDILDAMVRAGALLKPSMSLSRWTASAIYCGRLLPALPSCAART